MLLKRCIKDNCDEVRERTLLYISLLESSEDQLHISEDLGLGSAQESKQELLDTFFDTESTIDIDALENYVVANQENLHNMENFEIDSANITIKKEQAEEIVPVSQAKKEAIGGTSQQQMSIEQPVAENKDEVHLEALKNDPRMATVAAGEPEFVSQMKAINDSGSEYPVQELKYFYKEHVVVQYLVGNSLEDQKLAEVRLD